jgi:hypothetical protein
MKKMIFALILLLMLLLPMFWGISQIKRLPRGRADDEDKGQD